MFGPIAFFSGDTNFFPEKIRYFPKWYRMVLI